ncbi:hypothetical protein LguiA_029128 [Lonicera macranthoides]
MSNADNNQNGAPEERCSSICVMELQEVEDASLIALENISPTIQRNGTNTGCSSEAEKTGSFPNAVVTASKVTKSDTDVDDHVSARGWRGSSWGKLLNSELERVIRLTDSMNPTTESRCQAQMVTMSCIPFYNFHDLTESQFALLVGQNSVRSRPILQGRLRCWRVAYYLEAFDIHKLS